MPYRELRLGDHVSPALSRLVRDVIDQSLSDFRSLLMVRRTSQGPGGSFQRPFAMLLLSIADGAAQLLHPGDLEDSDRFAAFLTRNYPWDRDRPEGMTTAEACDFLWNEARCPMLHRFGVRAEPKGITKFGQLFLLTDDRLTDLESRRDTRPFSDPSLQRNHQRTVLWIETFYWGLRLAIEKALSDPAKCAEIERWIASGDFDPVVRRRRRREAKAAAGRQAQAEAQRKAKAAKRKAATPKRTTKPRTG